MMEIGIRIFRSVLVSLACFWQIARKVKREVSRKRKLRGLKERAWLCRSLVFPSPSLPLLFFSPLPISRHTIQWRDRGLRGGGGGGHPDPEIRGSAVSKQTQFGLKVRGGTGPLAPPWIRHCYRNACKRLWLVKTMKQRYMLIDYNPGVNREKNCDVTLPW